MKRYLILEEKNVRQDLKLETVVCLCVFIRNSKHPHICICERLDN